MRKPAAGRSLVAALGAVVVAVACGSSAGSSAGTVTIVAPWSGTDQANFMKVLKPFQDQTGITVKYESAADVDAALQTAVAAGKAPDVAAAPSLTLLTQLAQQGKVVPLNDVVDMSALQANYAKSWIDLGEPLRDGKLFEVFSWVDVRGVIWYSPKVFSAEHFNIPRTFDELVGLQDQMKGSGTTPWCIGLKSDGADDGRPGSDWIDEIVLSQAGPTVYDNWMAGKQKWSSPEIKAAFTTWGQILGIGDGNVYGGPKIVSASYKTAGDPLFTSPPKCFMHNQATLNPSYFTTDNPSLQPGSDFNFFALPDLNAQFHGAHVVAGDAWSMFRDTPQARKLIKYLTGADAQAIWVKLGGKLSPNKLTPVSAYPDMLSKESAQIVVNLTIARFGATDNMPSGMRTAAWQAAIKYVQNQGSLASILTNLDKVQKTAYASP